MAQETYNEPINKHIDWGGDASTGNLPVSGFRILEWIKNTLEGKAGCFYYKDEKYLIFADEENRDLYLSDPGLYADLLIASFDAPKENEAILTIESERIINILAGETGNYIDFTFDIINVSSEESTGENVNCVITFRNGNNIQTYRQTYPVKTQVHLLADEYLLEGENIISINITGQDTQATAIGSLTYNVINLDLQTNVNIGQNTGGICNVLYSLSGPSATAKTIQFYVDKDLVKEISIIDSSSGSRTESIAIPAGKHYLQIRALIRYNNENFYSKNHYYEVLNNSYDLVISLISQEFFNDFVDSLSVVLYENLEFDWANLSNRVETIGFWINDTLIQQIQTNPGIVHTFSYTPLEDGEFTFKISVENEIVRSFHLIVEENNIGIKETTDGLILKLSAKNRNNSETTKDVWNYGEYSTTFNNIPWNSVCGWNNNALVLSNGASASINIAPFTNRVLQEGLTIEIEFETALIDNLNSVLFLCYNNNIGLQLTATQASLRSANGVVISTRYKDRDRIKLAFVINPNGSADETLMFIINNGIIDRTERFVPTDSFNNSGATFRLNSVGATFKLYSIRVFNRAITETEEFNNFVIDSPDLLNIIARNDIFDGTNLSIEKIAAKLPVMLITCPDWPDLMSTRDKKFLVSGDIQYINKQNPELEFTTKNTGFRKQGTSSMAYPVPNIRIYTNGEKNSEFYDYQGNLVPKGMYAFKPNSLPVNCWTCKADFAESSMTHNTGVARLWNDVLYNAQLDGEYVFRTKAQKDTAAAKYPYDVRTTVDGFPIVVFYRLSNDASSPWIYMGQYNFNNDKSTESVFGWFDKDSPFYNPNALCYEVLDSNPDLALMRNYTERLWNEKWSDSYESRHPDTSTPDTTALKRLVEWVSSTCQNPTGVILSEEEKIRRMNEFKNHKQDYFDLPKLAAYYIYLMRFGAVDQTVKNAMLTTDDGLHWYYINYDNDTILGVRNDGRLVFDYTIDRQSMDPTSPDSPVYAGRNSTLWNNLEADNEDVYNGDTLVYESFMSLVARIDRAIASTYLTYDKIIKVFDEEQSNKWCEKLYNLSQRYKYIDRKQYLLNVLGNRKSHRHWWLSNRTNLYDSKFVSGDYGKNTFAFKMLETQLAGKVVKIISGEDFNYGWYVNSTARIVESQIFREKGQEYDIILSKYGALMNIGTPIAILGSFKVEELDISDIAKLITELKLTNGYDSINGSKLKRLIIGKESKSNTAMLSSSFEGLELFTGLEEIDIQGFENITSLDLANLINLKKLNASRSGLTTFIPADGANLVEVKLPGCITTIQLNNANIQTLNYTPTSTLRNLLLNNVNWDLQKLFVLNWITSLPNDNDCILNYTNINWTNSTVAEVKKLKVPNTAILSGHVVVNDLQESDIDELQELFGENVFDANNNFYITSSVLFNVLKGPSELVAGQSTKYSAVIIPHISDEIVYKLVGQGVTTTYIDDILYYTYNNKINLNSVNGEVSTTLDASTITLKVAAISGNVVAGKNLTVNARVRPMYTHYTELDPVDPDYLAIGDDIIENGTYGFYVWLSGSSSGFNAPIVRRYITTDLSQITCDYQIYQDSSVSLPEIVKVFFTTNIIQDIETGNITFHWEDDEGNIYNCKSFNITIIKDKIILSPQDNPIVYNVFKTNNLVPSGQDFLKISDCTKFKSSLLNSTFVGSNIVTFNEFLYFTGCSQLISFRECSYLTEIAIPTTINAILNYGFIDCASLRKIKIDKTVFIQPLVSVAPNLEIVELTDIYTYCTNTISNSCSPFTINKNGAFYYRGNPITELTLENCSIHQQIFEGCNSLEKLTLNNCIIGQSAFEYCTNLNTLNIINISAISTSSFSYCTSLKELTIPSDVTTISSYAFSHSGLETVRIEPRSEVLAIRSPLGHMNLLVCDILTYLEKIWLNGDALQTEWNLNSSDLIDINHTGSHIFLSNKLNYNKNIRTFTVSGTVSEDNILLAYHSNVLSINISNTNIWGTISASYCNLLSSISYPNSVSSIGPMSDNPSLTQFEILSGISAIGPLAFYRTSLLKLYFNDLNTLFKCNFGDLIVNTHVDYYVNGEKLLNVVVPSDAILLFKFAYTSIETVDLSAYIGRTRYAFYYCDKLSSITFNPNLTQIEDYEFYNCLSLTTISLPEALSTIDSHAFYRCPISNLRLPETLTQMSNSVFYGHSTSSLTIPESYRGQLYTDAIKPNDNYTLNLTINGTPSVISGILERITTLTLNTNVSMTAYTTDKLLRLLIIGPNVTQFDARFINAGFYLETITSLAISAPSVINLTISQVGTEAQDKKLIVPTNSTGYDTSIWYTLIHEFGYTLIETT